MPHWKKALMQLGKVGPTRADAYRLANINAIRAALKGQGPHGSSTDTNKGMRVVVNLAARHAVAFLDTLSGRPAHGRYLNGSGLRKLAGKPLSSTTVRSRVDAVVSKVASSFGRTVAPHDIHYGAAELNGTGISYFGDVCIVLKPDEVPAGTLTLLRNSYDLTVAPLFEMIYEPGNSAMTEANAKAEMSDWAGQWPDDARDIAAVKILQHAPPSERRLSTGQISKGVLDDEDYIEIALETGFKPSEVQELRLSADDVACEARIADRQLRGPSPTAAEMIWRYRRRQVDRNGRREGLPCRVVTHVGRGRAQW